MPVYAIRCGDDGPVKLGYAADPEGRLGELQVAHYQQLRIIRLWDGGSPEEALLHLRFADLRIRGEWFSFSRAMLGDVGLVEIINEPATVEADPIAVEPATPIRNGLARHLQCARMTQAAAAILVGVSQAEFSRWYLRQRRVPAEKAVVIHNILHIPLWDLRPDLWPSPAPTSANAA